MALAGADERCCESVYERMSVTISAGVTVQQHVELTGPLSLVRSNLRATLTTCKRLLVRIIRQPTAQGVGAHTHRLDDSYALTSDGQAALTKVKNHYANLKPFF